MGRLSVAEVIAVMNDGEWVQSGAVTSKQQMVLQQFASAAII
jgi:hypothetical protein